MVINIAVPHDCATSANDCLAVKSYPSIGKVCLLMARFLDRIYMTLQMLQMILTKPGITEIRLGLLIGPHSKIMIPFTFINGVIH